MTESERLNELLRSTRRQNGILTPGTTADVQAVVKSLRRGDIVDPFEICTALRILEEASMDEESNLVLAYLRHPHEYVRSTAVSITGGHWRIRDAVPDVLSLLKNDEETTVRQQAALALGSIFASTRDKGAIANLLHIVEDESEDPSVRTAAYTSLLKTWDYESSEAKMAAFNIVSISDIDRRFISMIRSALSIP